jgi:hypothetical protein
MQIRNIPHQLGAIRKAVGIVGPALVLAISEYLLYAQGASNKLPGVGLGSAPKLIYSSNADDAWNRIFYFLFSRRLQVRLSADFPEGAPFISSAGNPTVSSRTFERDETGDRAVDPLYPTYSVGVGSMLVLSDSAYPEFTAALHDALNENVQRSTIARALMQSDLWGAYDGLFPAFLPDDERRLGERRKTTLDLIGRLIRKVALTPDEINALPDNYASVVRHQSFPDMFAKDSGWIEVAWFLPRTHDAAVGFRRASRVFLKPARPPGDIRKFLEVQANTPEDPSALEGAALLTQLLLIDSNGILRPTRLTSEAQLRLFSRGGPTELKTSIRVCEISRRLLLQNADSGGLVMEDESAPAYLSNGGSYGFAEGHFMSGMPSEIGEPIEVKLRTRCALCHGENLTQIMTLSIALPPKPPPVRRLDPTAREIADIDIAYKRKLKDFQALHEYFNKAHQ